MHLQSVHLQEGISEGGWSASRVIWRCLRTGQWGKGSLMPLEWEPQPDPPPSFLAEKWAERRKRAKRRHGSGTPHSASCPEQWIPLPPTPSSKPSAPLSPASSRGSPSFSTAPGPTGNRKANRAAGSRTVVLGVLLHPAWHGGRAPPPGAQGQGQKSSRVSHLWTQREGLPPAPVWIWALYYPLPGAVRKVEPVPGLLPSDFKHWALWDGRRKALLK